MEVYGLDEMEDDVTWDGSTVVCDNCFTEQRSAPALRLVAP